MTTKQRPNAREVQHVAARPQVALHFNTDETGGTDVIIFVGTAAIDTITNSTLIYGSVTPHRTQWVQMCPSAFALPAALRRRRARRIGHPG